MSPPLHAAEVLNREFLEARARLLQLAAALDRLDRADGDVQDDARLAGIRKALSVLAGAGPDRAERLQMIFSLPYDEDWKSKFAIE